MIGGNITAIVQIKDKSQKNAIGEAVNTWVNIDSITGFLDYNSGETKYTSYSAKIQESTHIFICDYKKLDNLYMLLDNQGNKVIDSKSFAVQTETGTDCVKVNSENARLIIDGEKYDIMLFDDPMNLHKHLEFYLKYTGGDAYV